MERIPSAERYPAAQEEREIHTKIGNWMCEVARKKGKGGGESGRGSQPINFLSNIF